VVVKTGDMMTMPGLPETPGAVGMGIDEGGDWREGGYGSCVHEPFDGLQLVQGLEDEVIVEFDILVEEDVPEPREPRQL
jgi:hypothetical protein